MQHILANPHIIFLQQRWLTLFPFFLDTVCTIFYSPPGTEGNVTQSSQVSFFLNQGHAEKILLFPLQELTSYHQDSAGTWGLRKKQVKVSVGSPEVWDSGSLYHHQG